MIQINKLYLPAQLFSLAMSGGADSLACASLFHKMNIPYKAIHFNHNQRPQNDLMQDAVERFCADHGIHLTVGVCNVKVDSNIEDGLRKERLKFFESIGGDIVLCQHLDDAKESYLSNTLKGKPEYKPIPEFTHFENFNILRPFMRNEKKVFTNWVDKHSLSEYLVADESNQDERYERNWIRNSILPAIEARRPLSKIVLKKFYL